MEPKHHTNGQMIAEVASIFDAASSVEKHDETHPWDFTVKLLESPGKIATTHLDAKETESIREIGLGLHSTRDNEHRLINLDQ